MSTPEERSAHASGAARARWERVPDEERRRHGYALAVARWGTSAPMRDPEPERPARTCENCGAPVKRDPRVRFCSAPDCRLTSTHARLVARAEALA